MHAALRVAARHENADVELLDFTQEGSIAVFVAVKDWVGGRSKAGNYHLNKPTDKSKKPRFYERRCALSPPARARPR